MEVTVKNTGTGIKAFQHQGSVVSLGPGETFSSNLDFSVPEKQVLQNEPELEYKNSEEVVEVQANNQPEPKQEEVKQEEAKEEVKEEKKEEEAKKSAPQPASKKK